MSKILLVVLLFLCIGCGSPATKEREKFLEQVIKLKEEKAKEINRVHLDYYYGNTVVDFVEHDGNKFAVVRGHNCVSIIQIKE